MNINCSSVTPVHSVLVPDVVHGSGDVERLRHPVQARDPTVFPETSGCNGQRGQRSERQGQEHN